jgi:hypothetical protein
MLNRESKVANLGPLASAEEDVFGFDIEMEYFLGMNILHAATDIYPYLVCCLLDNSDILVCLFTNFERSCPPYSSSRYKFGVS